MSNDKKETMLEAGAKLFREHGYAATGVSEITKASDVPKGSFYHYFDSKEAFAAEIIRCYSRDLGAFLDQRLLQGEGSPLGRFRDLIDYFAENHYGKNGGCGCLAGNLAQEIARQSPELGRALSEALRNFQNKFAACLHMAKGAGELPAGANVDELAEFIYNAWQGTLLRAKADGDMSGFDNFRKVVFGNLLA